MSLRATLAHIIKATEERIKDPKSHRTSPRAKSKEIPSPPTLTPSYINPHPPQFRHRHLSKLLSMTIGDILHTVTSLVGRATKHLRPHPSFSHLAGPTAKLHLVARGASYIPFLSSGKKKNRSKKKAAAEEEEEEEEVVEEEEGVIWRRTIIMGKKCDPLDFSGAIHYDSEGNQVSDPPAKSPLRSPLPVLLMTVAVHPVTVNGR